MNNLAEPTLTDFIQAMPKAELHIHLEGSIRPETLLQLAERHGKTEVLPSSDLKVLRQWFAFTSFDHFLQIYLIIQDLLRSPEDFALIAYECGADMAAQNILYREVTFTPYTHTDFLTKGLSIEGILAGLEEGRQRARAEFGVEMRWIFDIPRNLAFPRRDGRHYDPRPAERTLEFALAGQNRGVIALGLGGSEVNAPPEPFAHAFIEAKAAGLLSLPHAGEVEGPKSVWGAIEALQADRIGHGVRSIEDPHLLVALKERQIPLEVNPVSNVCLHVYRRAAEHPFPHLDRAGLLLTVNSDDPPLFNTTLSNEYRVLAEEFGYGPAGLKRIARNAFAVSGAEPALKEQLLKRFNAWADEG